MDTFRKEYRELSHEEKQRVSDIKVSAEHLLSLITGGQTEANGREIALSKTNLQQAIMLAVNAITG